MCSNEKRTILLDGQFCTLSQTEYDVFTLLILYAGEVISREKFLHDVWGYKDCSKITTRSVDMCINRLRDKIGASRIESVYGKGYKLVLQQE